MATGSGFLVTWHLEVMLVPLPFSLCTLLTMHEHVVPLTLKAAKKGGDGQFNDLVDVYKKTLKSDGVDGLYHGFNIFCVGVTVYCGLYFGVYDSLKPLLPGDMTASLLALPLDASSPRGLASYPIDTVRRRMMMTSGEAVKYKSSMDAFQQIPKEGAKSMFKGDGAIIMGVIFQVVLCSLDTKS